MANFTFIPPSGTVSAVITATEYSLPRNANYSSASPQTTQGYVAVVIDRSNLVTGDSYTLNVYEKAGAGATQRPLLDPMTIVPSASLYAVALPLVGDGWDATLKLATGSARTMTWSIRIDTNDVNALTVSGGVVAAIQAGIATAAALATVAGNVVSLGSAVAALPSAAANAVAVMGSVVESALTVTGSLRLLLSQAVNKLTISGASYAFRDVADTKNRIVGTASDVTGRTAITLDAT